MIQIGGQQARHLGLLVDRSKVEMKTVLHGHELDGVPLDEHAAREVSGGVDGARLGVDLRAMSETKDQAWAKLVVEASVDAASGADSEYEDDESVIADVVDDAVAADADASPPGRPGQHHGAGWARFGAEGCDRPYDSPAVGRIKFADLLAS